MADRYRRMQLVLRYTRYLLTDGPTSPRLALQETAAMAATPGRHGSWWSDVQHALATLPVLVVLDWEGGANVANIDGAIAELASSLARHLHDGIMASARLPLLCARMATSPPATLEAGAVAAWHPYLNIERAPVRAAVTSPGLGAPLSCRDTPAPPEQASARAQNMPLLQTPPMRRRQGTFSSLVNTQR